MKQSETKLGFGESESSGTYYEITVNERKEVLYFSDIEPNVENLERLISIFQELKESMENENKYVWCIGDVFRTKVFTPNRNSF